MVTAHSRRAGKIIVAILLSLLAAASTASAPATNVRYLGLHDGKANLRIDRRSTLLAVGESKQGIHVLLATRDLAIVRMAGRSYLIEKRREQAQPLDDEITIDRRHGMFFVAGRVNGKTIRFVVDTGASHVVLSARQARRLRLRYSTHDPVRIHTASGRDLAYATTLDSVSVGGIVLNKVAALITRGKAPEVALLGMTFLSQLKVYQDAEQMRMSR